jgi:tRNA1Val (adenine37-N6)-methyltransferase
MGKQSVSSHHSRLIVYTYQMARKTKDIFRFKQFAVKHDRCAHKVGTDGVLLGAWIDVSHANRILDIGTGSGVIALMLAQRSSAETHIDAIDISQEDCQQARENIADSPWPDKIRIENISFQKFESDPYDLIVSNPPFFIDSAKPPKEERTRARHTESLPPVELLTHAKRLLSPGGKLCIILPITEGKSMITQAESLGWHCTRFCEFRARDTKPVERLLFQLQLSDQGIKNESLILYEYDEEWTTDYKNLTREFYLKL